MSLRGTKHSDQIPSYSSFPSNLSGIFEANELPYQSITTSNVARDIIASIKEAKSLHPFEKQFAIGISYGKRCAILKVFLMFSLLGTYVTQRILQMEPNLLDGVILDGVVDPVNLNIFRMQSIYRAELASLLSENCQRSEYCRERSFSHDYLGEFYYENLLLLFIWSSTICPLVGAYVDSLYSNPNPSATNPCWNFTLKYIFPGAPAAGEEIPYCLLGFHSFLQRLWRTSRLCVFSLQMEICRSRLVGLALPLLSF